MRTLCVLLAASLLASCVASGEPAPSPVVPDGGASLERLLVGPVGEVRGPPHDRPELRAVRSQSPVRPAIVQPSPRAVVVRPSERSGHQDAGRSVSGLSSWYCRAGISICTHGYPAGSMVAAAGPRLRAAIGSTWRGRIVRINGLRVRLVDWCQCYKGRANEKLVDLYYAVWVKVGGRVTVTW